MKHPGPILLLLTGIAALWLVHDRYGAPYLTPDSEQYLDSAAHLASGQCLCTDVAHFDEQTAYGRFPVPFTHFPPGFPTLMAGVSVLGLPLDQAGYVVSAFGFLLSLQLLWDLSLRLGASPWAAALLCLPWLTHSLALASASMVTTETIFTAVLMLLADLMVRDIQSTGRRAQWLTLAIGGAAGAAYWIRYAGLFLVPVAAAYLVWQWWRRRNTAWTAAALALLAGLTFSVQIRNIHYTGSWRGGFTTGSHHALSSVLKETVKGFYHLTFGDRVVARVDLWTVLLLLSMGCLVWLTARARWPRRGNGGSVLPLASLVWLGALGLAYAGGVTLAALVTIAADLSRYYLPLFPMILAIVAAIFSMVEPTNGRILSLEAVVICVVAIQSRSLFTPPPEPMHAVVSAAFAGEVQPGINMRQWLLAHTGTSGVVAAVNGQAVYQVLHRPVVSIISPEFSNRTGEAGAIRELMSRFKAKYLVVFPGHSGDFDEQRRIPLLNNLAEGQSPPAWLTPVARNRNSLVLECAECVR